ncbi:universal stress protein [Kitasatospora sp. NBC_00240]|uniref:universal stress protein n=1 Tax=Kitasatospora sp. NBC_00240 TaxID=2903567 RepID=UPI0022537E29|nr:universal stress protein [Kitasatospora sp. NBC_00240]MCX5208225.1 universal stress protein [Kitasatospora sp. NBC_00240]
MMIVGFDGSGPSRAAVEWAAGEATRRELPLEILQARPWEPSGSQVTGQAERRGREQLAVQADDVRSRFPGLEVRAQHLPDDAVGVLKAASHRASVLVLGSRGLGALRGFLVGSVSQQVLGHAACPVVLVRPPSDLTDGPGPDNLTQRGLVVGLDLAHPCPQVLAFAFETAALRGVPLTVLHAWGPPAGTEYMHFGAIGGLEDELAGPEREALEDAVKPWLAAFPDLPAATELLRSHAGLALVDAAATAELLVIGARHRRRTGGTHLGPVAHAVIHHVRCPVAVVPYH